jgi:hypothetical protein
VVDTPPQQAADYGNPNGMIVSCGNGPYGNLYMDFMDFTDDAGLHMFTYGQRARMRSLFAAGGFRYPLLSSPAASVAAISGGATTVGVTGNTAELNLRLYPNPATTMVSVRMDDPASLGAVLDVYNQVGQKVMSQRVTELTLQMDVSSLAGGVYFVRLRGGQTSNGIKLVKIK